MPPPAQASSDASPASKAVRINGGGSSGGAEVGMAEDGEIAYEGDREDGEAEPEDGEAADPAHRGLPLPPGQ